MWNFKIGIFELMSLKSKWRKLKYQIEVLFLPFFARFRKASILYYVLFNSEFGREQQAILNGKLQYQKSLKRKVKSSALLRRNTHRLEKGIIMRPRKDVFALDYIHETVAEFVRLKASEDVCEREIKWAGDVINKYFNIITLKEDLISLRSTFIDAYGQSDSEENHYIPYKSDCRAKSSIGVDELQALFEQRRSTRWFQQKPVDEELLSKAVHLASYAPSACNRQPYEFMIINDSELIQKVAKIPMGTAGFHNNIPCLVVVVGDLAAFPEERDRHVIYIDASLASMQFMLALETLGLGSCPINWPDIEKKEAQMAQELKLCPSKRVVMLIGIGEPDPSGYIPYSQKKSPVTFIN